MKRLRRVLWIAALIAGGVLKRFVVLGGIGLVLISIAFAVYETTHSGPDRCAHGTGTQDPEEKGCLLDRDLERYANCLERGGRWSNGKRRCEPTRRAGRAFQSRLRRPSAPHLRI